VAEKTLEIIFAFIKSINHLIFEIFGEFFILYKWNKQKICSCFNVADPGSGAFLPPGSGSGMIFSGSRIRSLFWLNFRKSTSESLLCYLDKTGLLLKLTPETKCSKKICRFSFATPFSGIRIRDKKFSDSEGKTFRIRQHWAVLNLSALKAVFRIRIGLRIRIQL
jgi:hypothetical protein